MRTITALLIALLASVAEAQIIKSPGGGASVGEDVTFVFSEETIRFGFGDYTSALLTDYAILTQAYGTGTNVAPTATDYGRFWKKRKTSTAAINSLAGQAQAGAVLSISPMYGTRRDGFMAVLKFGVPNGFVSTNNALIGMYPTLVDPTGSTNLAGVASTLYFGFVNPQTTWHVCAQDGVVTRTCIDTGLAITTAGVVFEVMITSTIASTKMRVRRIETAIPVTVYDGDAPATLPVSTTTLRWLGIAQTGASAASVVIDFISAYVTYPY